MQLIFYKIFTPYYLLTWNQMGSSSHPNTRPMLWILYLSPNQPGRASLHDPFHPASTTDDYCNLLNFTHHLADSLDFEGLSLRVHRVQHVQHLHASHIFSYFLLSTVYWNVEAVFDWQNHGGQKKSHPTGSATSWPPNKAEARRKDPSAKAMSQPAVVGFSSSYQWFSGNLPNLYVFMYHICIWMIFIQLSIFHVYIYIYIDIKLMENLQIFGFGVCFRQLSQKSESEKIRDQNIIHTPEGYGPLSISEIPISEIQFVFRFASRGFQGYYIWLYIYICVRSK